MSKFSGRGVIEPFHVQFETPAGSHLPGDHLYRSGDVWVGVSVATLFVMPGQPRA